ncbi:MAG: hypothetical protein KDB03_22515 [Planctomycetales bacterium]|nr:hypothetical protein [Planctomycetales bacterium]
MSSARLRRETTSPTLFPFLAVLLCTMGALVLILMLLVSIATNTSKQAAEQQQQQVSEAQSLLELAAESLSKQLYEGQIELEKKRLGLQHLENHTQELLKELENLHETAQLLKEQSEDEEQNLSAQQVELSELEKQLADAFHDLENKQSLEKANGDKPIFAIIPYDGPNGTHRRPIYLECIADGLILQPEGVPIPLADLQPPYGPGNPLDAALRTVRSAYAPANGAVNSTAYPLLVVRPEGIKSYTLARAAMTGWDDQFGYELVTDNMDLVYPESEIGLKDKLIQALVLARERQAALVMAMPRRYRQFVGQEGSNELIASPANGFDESWIDGPSVKPASMSNGNTDQLTASNLAYNPNLPPGTRSGVQTSGATTETNFPFSPSAKRESMVGFSSQPLNASSSDFPSSNLNATYDASTASYLNDPSTTGKPINQSIGDPPGNGPLANGGSAGSNFAQASSDFHSTDVPSSQTTAGGTASRTGNSSDANGGAGNSAASMLAASPQDPSAASQLSTTSASVENTSPQISLSQDFASRPLESSRPVAHTEGKNWAWSNGTPTQTTVVRPIKLRCTIDGWLVLPDAGSNQPVVTIPYELAPVQRATRLADVVAQRVQSWGLAVAGGFWKPVLVVEVDPKALWRFEQLKQLLDGSGLEVRVKQ